MNHAKFCTAAQDWSTPRRAEVLVLLRRVAQAKHEEDHAVPCRAMALRGGGERQSASRINRLIVKTGKSRATVGFGYGRAKFRTELIVEQFS
jgi:hypothetical protein